MVVDQERTHKLYWVIALLIMIILFLIKCNGEIAMEDTKEKDCGEVISVTYDTINIRTIDTIEFIDTIKYYVKVEIPVPIYDPVTELNTYTSQFEDSLLSGSVVSTVNGVLVDQEFTYTPKFPKYIMIYDTTKITETITKVLPSRIELYIGLYAGGNKNTFNLTPVVSIKDKKDRIFSYGYNVIDNTHNVGFQTKITLKNE